MNIRRSSVAAMLLASSLAACQSSPSSDLPLEGRPLTEAEIEYQRQLELSESVPLGAADKSELLVRVDQNIHHWQRANLDTVGSRNRELVDNLNEILQRTVYLNFDVLLEFVERGDAHQKAIAAAALGFARLREPADPAERERFLARWPQVYSRAIPALMNALSDPEEAVVQNALLGLWKLGDPETPLPPILERLEDESVEIRAMAALALSTILTPKTGEAAISGLVNALNDPSPKVRVHAVSAVMATRHPNAAGSLARLLNDNYLLVQANAARALGDSGDWRNCEFLLARLATLLDETPSGKFRRKSELDQRRELVANHLIGALERLSGEQYGDQLEEWHEWWNEKRTQS